MPVEQVILSGDGIEVTILPGIGARIHRLRVLGHDLLRTPHDVDEHRRDPLFWGAYVMAPWCNRIDAGVTDVGRRRVVLEATFGDGSAIHGQVNARAWNVIGEGTFEIAGAADGWPWPYRTSLSVRIGPSAVELDQRLTNDADNAMPAGLGLHPWFMRPGLLAIRGDVVEPDNTARQARPQAVAGRFDLRNPVPVPDDLDAAWSELGELPVEMRWATLGLGLGLTMRIEATTRFVAAATPAGLDAIAVEPQTHAPWGLRRLLEGQPGGLTWLEPGESLRVATRLEFVWIADEP
jgi:aldose 1-epimerase